MPNDLLQLVDAGISLAFAFWLIFQGLKRMDASQEQYRTFTQQVIDQQQNNNDQLMSLVSTLCAAPAPRRDTTPAANAKN